LTERGWFAVPGKGLEAWIQLIEIGDVVHQPGQSLPSLLYTKRTRDAIRPTGIAKENGKNFL
jgi:hypothetical protein